MNFYIWYEVFCSWHTYSLQRPLLPSWKAHHDLNVCLFCCRSRHLGAKDWLCAAAEYIPVIFNSPPHRANCYLLIVFFTLTHASKDTAEHHTLLAGYLLQRGERGSGGDGHSPNISLFRTLFFDCKLICSVKGCAAVLWWPGNGSLNGAKKRQYASIITSSGAAFN